MTFGVLASAARSQLTPTRDYAMSDSSRLSNSERDLAPRMYAKKTLDLRLPARESAAVDLARKMGQRLLIQIKQGKDGDWVAASSLDWILPPENRESNIDDDTVLEWLGGDAPPIQATSPKPPPKTSRHAPPSVAASPNPLVVAPQTSGARLCPFCQESIKDAAIKCKHCGEFLDERVAASRSWNPNVAAVLNLLLPGVGHIYMGKTAVGILLLFLSVPIDLWFLWTPMGR